MPAEVPVWLLPLLVAVIVELAPACVRVTAWLERTPAVKAALVVQPLLHVRLELTTTVPVKAVAVLLLTSWATILTLKLVPAVCVAMLAPLVFVPKKWLTRPGLTVTFALAENERPSSVPVMFAVPTVVDVSVAV